MNNRQRKILIAVGSLIGLMLLYPPFQIMWRGLGYSWIFSPPYDAATINAGQLLVQWVAVALIGGIAFVLSKESQVATSSVPEAGGAAMPQGIAKPSESSDQDPSNPLYEAIVGDKNRDRYLVKFAKFDQRPTELIAGWNWSAFFFSGVWALYRKMYGWFFAFWALTFFSKLVEKASPGLSALGLSVLVILVPWVAFTVYADALYHRHARAKIAAASHFNNPSALLDHLHKKGGVHKWVIFVFGLLPIIGILAAILIPMFARQ